MHKEHMEAVAKMQKYIQVHLEETITLHQLAEACNYSLWHAAKLFKELTGKSPFQYIRDMRLTQAALILRDTKDLVLETALDFHFDSHEGFTKAFTKTFGMSPQKYRQNLPPIPLFFPYVVKDFHHYLKKRRMIQLEKTQTVFTQIIQKPQRKLIVLRGQQAKDYFSYCEEVGCDIWGELLSFKGVLTEPAGYWLPDTMRAGKSTYVQGVELPKDYQGIIPAKFDVIELDEGFYMIFQGEPYPEDEETFMVKISELQNAIKSYQPELYGYKFDLSMPKFQFAPVGERGYIEGVPVIPIKKNAFKY